MFRYKTVMAGDFGPGLCPISGLRRKSGAMLNRMTELGMPASAWVR